MPYGFWRILDYRLQLYDIFYKNYSLFCYQWTYVLFCTREKINISHVVVIDIPTTNLPPKISEAIACHISFSPRHAAPLTTCKWKTVKTVYTTSLRVKKKKINFRKVSRSSRTDDISKYIKRVGDCKPFGFQWPVNSSTIFSPEPWRLYVNYSESVITSFVHYNNRATSVYRWWKNKKLIVKLKIYYNLMFTILWTYETVKFINYSKS